MKWVQICQKIPNNIPKINVDKYQYACELVEELLESVYEDYKKYCYRNGVNTLGKIYKKIEEGITSKKGFNNNTYGGNYMNNFTYDDNDLHWI